MRHFLAKLIKFKCSRELLSSPQFLHSSLKMNEVNSLKLDLFFQSYPVMLFFITLSEGAKSIRFVGQLKPIANKDFINTNLGISLNIIVISQTMTHLSLQPNPLPPADPMFESSVALEWFGVFANC